MTIIPSPTYETTPRFELITDIMLLLDDAIKGGEDVSTWNLAERIVEMAESSDPDFMSAFRPYLG